MKDNKTIIAVLISLVVVIVAFYIRVSPAPNPEETTSISSGETQVNEIPPAEESVIRGEPVIIP